MTLKNTSLLNKPLIGISSCLAGEKVRYDGKCKSSNLFDALSPHIDWLNFCPEVDAGLGIPRPAVQLVDVDRKMKALGVFNKNLDVTDKLIATSSRFWAKHTQNSGSKLVGYIFKSRSPSCGLSSTPIFDLDGNLLSFSSGFFAAAAGQFAHADKKISNIDFVFSEETTLETSLQQALFISACYLASHLRFQTPLDSALTKIVFEYLYQTSSTDTLFQAEQMKELLRMLRCLLNDAQVIRAKNDENINQDARNEKTALQRRLISYWQL